MNLSNKEEELSQYIDEWNGNGKRNQRGLSIDPELDELLDTVDIIKISHGVELPSQDFQDRMRKTIQREMAAMRTIVPEGKHIDFAGIRGKKGKWILGSPPWRFSLPLAAACVLILFFSLPYLFQVNNAEADQLSVVKVKTLVNLGQSEVMNPFALKDGKIIGFGRAEKITLWSQVDQRTKDFSLDDFKYMRTPAWSPDGSRIAFSGYKKRNAGIWLMNQDGSNRQQLTLPETPDEFHDLPAWSPDGKRIAFTKHLYTLDDQHGVTNTMEIWVLNLATGKAKRITEGSEPNWSPDGSQLAFTKTLISEEPVEKEIWLIKEDGTKAKRLTRGKEPSWSPDGQFIAFSNDSIKKDKVNGKNVTVSLTELWAINLYNKKISQLTKTNVNENQLTELKSTAKEDVPIQYFTSGEYSDTQPSWSKDGKSIVFVRDTNKEKTPNFSLMKLDVIYE